MSGFFAALVCTFLLIGYFFVIKYRELYRHNELSVRVSWVVSDKKRDMSLLKYVGNAQIHCEIEEQYRISTDEEWRFVKEILEEFKKDLSNNYFNGVLRNIKSKYVITEEQYFMLALCAFLREHQCDYDFIGYGMRDKTLEHKSYGNLSYSAIYIVSDFAIVFNKLLYVSYISCKNSKGINSNGQYYDNESYIEEIIKTKQLVVNRF